MQKSNLKILENYLLIYPDLKRNWNSYIKIWLHWLFTGKNERRISPLQLKQIIKSNTPTPDPINIPPIKIKNNKKRDYLLIVCAGDKSLHRQWLENENPEEKNWDLMILQYSDKKDWSNDAEYYAKIKGIKFKLISFYENLFIELSKHYKYIAIWDDDLFLHKGTISDIFSYADQNNFYLCQPSLKKNGNEIWGITTKVDGLKHRETNFVEIMAPIMRVEFFIENLKIFKINPFGYALDTIVWPNQLMNNSKKMGIIDEYEIMHTRKPCMGDLRKKGDFIKFEGFFNMKKYLMQHNMPYSDIKEMKNIKKVAINN